MKRHLVMLGIFIIVILAIPTIGMLIVGEPTGSNSKPSTGSPKAGKQETIVAPLEGTNSPWIAGYMDESERYSYGVRIQVSFAGTSPSIVPSGNYLEAGMMAQAETIASSGCVVNGISYKCAALDWTFFAFARLTSSGVTLYGSIWTAPDFDETPRIVDSFQSASPSFTTSDSVTITMRWSGNTLNWIVRVNGGPEWLVHSYNAYSFQAKIFHIGSRTLILCRQPFCTVKWFQFGISSVSSINSSGWNAVLQSPQYLVNDVWADVVKASPTLGLSAFVDRWYVIGSDEYPNVGIDFCRGNSSVPFGRLVFHPGSYPGNRVLWDNSCTKADFSFSSSPASISISPGQDLCCTLSASLGTVNGYLGGITVSLTGVSSCVGASIVNPTRFTSLGGASGEVFSIDLSVPSNCTPATTTGILTAFDGIITHSSTFTLVIVCTQNCFTIVASPSMLPIPIGSEQHTTVTVSSNYGWSGTVHLTQNPSAGAVGCWFGGGIYTVDLFVPSGGSASTYPGCAGWGPAGFYSVTFSGTSGSMSNSATVPISVTDFSITDPTPVFPAGSSSSNMVILSSLAGFSGTVNLSTSAPSGVTVSCPSSVTLVPYGNATPFCSFSSSTPGTYMTTITGTHNPPNPPNYWNPSFSRSLNVRVTVTAILLTNNATKTSDWTILSGSWCSTCTNIDGTGAWAEIKSTNSFASDRSVTVNATSLTTGSNPWNTAWIRGKFIDDNNAVTLILHTDGVLELQVRLNAVQRTIATNSTGLDPTIWHTFELSFTGNYVNAYVDQVLYLKNIYDTSFTTLGASGIALMNGGNTESIFQDVKINNNVGYTLTLQGFDYDGTQEETLTINHQTVAQIPGVEMLQNGQKYVGFTIDITYFVISGYNQLTFTHAPWDCGVIDYTSNVMITDPLGNVLLNQPTPQPLDCTDFVTYSFTV